MGSCCSKAPAEKEGQKTGGSTVAPQANNHNVVPAEQDAAGAKTAGDSQAAPAVAIRGMQRPVDSKDLIFVIGGPGCGKGTQSKLIAEQYKDVLHLSVGDLLRTEVESGSELGKELEATMKAGELVETDQVLKLMTKAINGSQQRIILIDGFPRNLDQGKRFEETLKPVEVVLLFDCPEEVMLQRLTKRGETSGRADDQEETIRKRIASFQENNRPIEEYYEWWVKLVKIPATETPEMVFRTVQQALEKRERLKIQKADAATA